jgi:tetratricopeptide (TPR) repeat protein
MFFPRLRRRAKWVFLLLALAFAFGFVAFGVGAGGSGIGDYLADLFNRQPGGDTPDSGQARERVQKNPEDAPAQLDLANALQAEGKTTEAAAALEAYLKLRPQDEDALQQLASLYLIQAGQADQRAQTAQLEAQEAFFGNELRQRDSRLSENLATDPITTFVEQQATQEYTTALTAAQAAHGKEADVWKRLTKLNPDESTFYLELGRSSQAAGDTSGAVKAYERYLELSPEAAEAKEIRQLIKALKESAAGSP